MIDGVNFRLEGLAAAEQALNALAADLRRKVVLGALRDAARPIVREARRLAPVLKTSTKRRVPGTVRRNVSAFRSKRYKPAQGAIGVYITVRATKARLRRAPVTGDPYYWRWLEGGHKIVPRTAKGLTPRQLRRLGVSITHRRLSSIKRVKPYQFITPAWNRKREDALRIFEKRIGERIERANRAQQ